MSANESGSLSDKEQSEKIARLLQAAKIGAVQELKAMLEQKTPVDGIDPNDPEQNTALHIAAENGHAEIARLLLKNGADPNKRRTDDNGRSPLHLAAANGHVELTEVLLAYGANINQTGNMGMTALYRACTTGQIETAKSLIFHGANMHQPDIFGVTALESAALSKKPALVKLMKTCMSFELYIDEDFLTSSAKKIENDFLSKPEKTKTILTSCVQQFADTMATKILADKQTEIENKLKKMGIKDNDLPEYVSNAKEFLSNCLIIRLTQRVSTDLTM